MGHVVSLVVVPWEVPQSLHRMASGVRTEKCVLNCSQFVFGDESEFLKGRTWLGHYPMMGCGGNAKLMRSKDMRDALFLLREEVMDHIQRWEAEDRAIVLGVGNREGPRERSWLRVVQGSVKRLHELESKFDLSLRWVKVSGGHEGPSSGNERGLMKEWYRSVATCVCYATCQCQGRDDCEWVRSWWSQCTPGEGVVECQPLPNTGKFSRLEKLYWTLMVLRELLGDVCGVVGGEDAVEEAAC